MTSSPRNSYEDFDCLLKPVDDFTLFAGFSCGDADLDDFFINEAQPHEDQLLAKMYSFYLKDNWSVSDAVAFCSMSNDSVKLSNRKKSQTFPEGKRYKSYPAVKIGRLGTRREYQGQSIGSRLLWAVKVLFITDNRTGCRFVTVDAYNTPRAIHFYARNDFFFLTDEDKADQSRSMYCDLLRFKNSLVDAG